MTIIPVSIVGRKIERLENEIETLTFKGLGLKEEAIEEFIRTNIDSLFGDEQSLLIVGQQVRNKEGGRCDLVAIDAGGNLVLIEIKRDYGDIRSRKEAPEFQAIRYAANFAGIKTPDDLVNKLFAPYIEKHPSEFSGTELTETEKAKRKLSEFLSSYNAEKSFNLKQRIVLIASAFDAQTLSACAWLCDNGLDICCFQVHPVKLKNQLMLHIVKILPPPNIEDYYVDVEPAMRGQKLTDTGQAKGSHSRMGQLFACGIVKKGDILAIRNFPGSEAVVVDPYYVRFDGKKVKYNKWGQSVTGWSSIGIYALAVHLKRGKTLDELRKEILDDMGGKAARQQIEDD